MKKIILSISFLIALVLSNTSCSNYLDIVPEGTPSMDNAFSNRINSFKYLHTCYSYLPMFDHPSNSLGFLAGDEHWLLPEGQSLIQTRLNITAWRIGRGAQNSNSPYYNYWDGGNQGTNLWRGIRDCNIFLENISKPHDIEEYERDRWIAEVKFLKAYYHFFLFQLYGPIPITDINMDVDAGIDAVRRYRDPADEVVKYVSDLLDEATPNLPLKITNEIEELGRITQPIAKAVKAQLLLLAASPLFNGNPDYANVKDNRGRNIFPAEYDANKWRLAADAALDAINVAKEAQHDLYYFRNIMNISDATRKLLDIGESVTDKWNKEIIWGSTRNQTGDLQVLSMAKTSKGTAGAAVSVLSPTMTVVEQFYSSNGVPISEDKGVFWSMNYNHRYELTTIPDKGNNIYYLQVGEKTVNLHLNREPRFYASLAFDRGTRFPAGALDDTPKNLEQYKFRAQEYSGLMNSENHSITGYLNKKVCSSKTVLTNNNLNAHAYSFPIIRLADVYLMYAEALNESLSTPDDEVYKYIDLVRARAGLEGVKDSWNKYSKYPNKPNTREGMREIIQMERLNELACEGKRFWDMRRWKKELPGSVYGWNEHGKSAEDFYKLTEVDTRRSRYTYKDFLWPISIDAIQKDPNLVQNPGWDK